MSDANRFRFRAWNRYKKKLMRVAVLDVLADEVKVMKPNGEQVRRAWPLCDVDLIQSTGLTDQNGTEIFEGDVVRIADSVNAWIIWNEENASFATRGVISRDDSEHLFGAPSCCEVIGNIHENPELLEQP